MKGILRAEIDTLRRHYYRLYAISRYGSAGLHLNAARRDQNTDGLNHFSDRIVTSKSSLSYPKESLYNILTTIFKHFGDRTAMINGISGYKLDYSTLLSHLRSFGTVLQKDKFKPGDVIGLVSPNCPEYPVVALGALGCKGIVSTINPTYTVSEIVYQLEDSGANMLVAEESCLDKALRAAEITGLKKVYVIGNYNGTDNDVISWNDILNEDGSTFPNEVEVDTTKDIAFIPYSSGTTGKAKGVMLSHLNIISNVLQMQRDTEPMKCSSALGLLPFFHIYGLVVVLFFSLSLGSTVVTLPNFQPESFLKTISDHKLERVFVVPPLLQFLLKNPMVKNYDLSFIKEITTGAAPCASHLHEAVSNALAPALVRQGYGLTETSPVVLTQPYDNIKPGSTGRPVSDTEVKVVDIDTGKPLNANESGELCVRGPQVMLGYLNRPEATASCLTEDGWYYTGDIGYYDEDHHFYIVDRLKELIKYKGFQVPPAELEDLLLSHPQVIDAAVIGIPDDEAGELPKAFVAGKNGVTEDELLSFVESNVAPHKRLRGGVQLVESIPRAVSGKILRRELRKTETKPVS